MDIQRQFLYQTVGAALLAGAFHGTVAADAGDATVLRWNEIAVQTVGATPPFPSTRAMATVQVAVFEAVNAITGRYAPYLGTVATRDGASAEAAAITAAHDTLLWLFPGQQSLLDAKQAESLAGIVDGAAKADGMAAGREAAAAMIAARTNDGAAPPQFYTPGNAAAYEWQLTPGCANAPANNRGLFFHWQFVKPFGVESSSQFRAPPPPPLASGRYVHDFDEVKAVGEAVSGGRPQDRADVASFFAVQPPHRGWNLVARQIATARDDEITATTRTLALMNMALSDSHITVFDSKYFYRTWRPETAIRSANDDGNPRTVDNPDYRSYIAAPCFPAYPSAHGSGGGAARAVLERAYGRKGHDVTMTEAAAPGIVLRYTDLRDITDDVSDARVFGGIHFRFDQELGDKMGEDVGRYLYDTLLRPVEER